MPVAAALHQYVEHCTVLVHRAPQPVLLAVDGDHHFVEVPLVASGWRGRADTPGNAQPEPHRPASHRFVGDIQTALREQITRDVEAARRLL